VPVVIVVTKAILRLLVNHFALDLPDISIAILSLHS
jgi:hypothetical protein